MFWEKPFSQKTEIPVQICTSKIPKSLFSKRGREGGRETDRENPLLLQSWPNSANKECITKRHIICLASNHRLISTQQGPGICWSIWGTQVLVVVLPLTIYVSVTCVTSLCLTLFLCVSLRISVDQREKITRFWSVVNALLTWGFIIILSFIFRSIFWKRGEKWLIGHYKNIQSQIQNKNAWWLLSKFLLLESYFPIDLHKGWLVSMGRGNRGLATKWNHTQKCRRSLSSYLKYPELVRYRSLTHDGEHIGVFEERSTCGVLHM